MLNAATSSKARDNLAVSENKFLEAQAGLIESCEQLHNLRSGTTRALVLNLGAYLDSLEHRPSQYDRTLNLFEVNAKKFDESGESFGSGFTQELKAPTGAATESIAGLVRAPAALAATGVGLGAATALGGPAAGMAIATTLGTTATSGVAISSLTGAAATKAALAWLGGGALSTGGGGIVAGKALLAMSGPIGLALVGTTAVAGMGWTAWKLNKAALRTAQECDEAARVRMEGAKVAKQATQQVAAIYSRMVVRVHNLRVALDALSSTAPKDFSMFSDEDKEKLDAMLADVLALARQLLQVPGEDLDLAAAPTDSELGIEQTTTNCAEVAPTEVA